LKGSRSDLEVNTQAWLDARRSRLGASPGEVSCALRIPGGFGSPDELWGEKVLGRRRMNIDPMMAAIGHAVEAIIPEFVHKRLGDLERGGWWTDNDTCIASSMDWRQAAQERRPIECKSAWWGLGGKHYTDDECNPAVTLQALLQARLCGAPAAHVVAIVLGGYGPELRIYDLEMTSARERLIDNVREAANSWWDRHVVAQLPPPGSPPVLWAASAGLRGETDSIDATDEHRALAEELVALADQVKPLVAREKSLRTRLAEAAQGVAIEGEDWAFRPDTRFKYRLSGRKNLRPGDPDE